MSHVEKIETDVFPAVGDLEGLVEEIGVQEMRGLLKHEGIFISCQKEKLAGLLSRYYLSKDFYNEAFNHVRQKEHGMALTGIRMHCDDLTKIHDYIFANRSEQLTNSRYAPKFIGVDRKSDTELQVAIQYERINPRFTNMHRRETYDVKADIKMEGGFVEVIAFQTASTDSIIVRDLTHHLAKAIQTEVVNIDLKALPVRRRVDLFDTLLKDDTRLEWRIDKCCGLAIRNGADEEDERSLSDAETQVLHSAILDGENLRDHQIVKDLVKQTYFFSSASFFAYQNASQDYQVRIKVDFKQNPTVLVVTAESARQFSDSGSDKHEAKIIDKKIGAKCVRYFWDRVHELFRIQRDYSQKNAKTVNRDTSPDDMMPEVEGGRSEAG